MLLEIKNLNIHFHSGDASVHAVKNLSLNVSPGETLGIVGESGSGKSVTALSIMRLLPAAKVSGEIWWRHSGGSTKNKTASAIDLMQLPESGMRRIRGAQIAMIFQEPMTSLNPVIRCGPQIVEAIHQHRNVSHEAAQAEVLSLFERVNLPDPKRIFRAFPHELSGGQKQRIMIAMAMSGKPALLLADEPTTALDVTVQKSILELMRQWRDEAGLSMIFISHDLGVISEIADRVAVMQAGEIVETGPVDQILYRPQHPYTKGLLACRPSLHRKLHRLPTVDDFSENTAFEPRVVTKTETEQRHTALYAHTPILEVKNLDVQYPVRRDWIGRPAEWLPAVDSLSFDMYPGEIFGLAGESGCGKTTLGRAVCRFAAVQGGVIKYRGLDLGNLSEQDFRPLRREIQMVFQDPYASLNPRMTIGQTLLEPMEMHRLYANNRQRREKVAELLQTVGLEAGHADRYPRAFSGGQRQRICLARALALHPKLLICDEIVSSLDVSVQATILNLLLDLRERFGLTYLFISHDLSVIKQMCDRLLVMNRGKAEAIGFPEDLFKNPPTEYVRKLIGAVPGEGL